MHEETLLARLKKSTNEINTTITTTRHKVWVLPFWSFIVQTTDDKKTCGNMSEGPLPL